MLKHEGTLVLRGGRVIDPETNLDAVADIAISRGSVTEIGDDLSHEATTSIDARGLVVTAGFIDLHSHSDWSDGGSPIGTRGR